MSEFHVEVVRLGEAFKHPNADTLSITQVNGYPTIFKTGDFKQGDLAVFVPVDAIVPKEDPRWNYLKDKNRIKAMKLRGVFSLGTLTHSDPSWKEGQNVQKELQIEKYEAPIVGDKLKTDGLSEKDPHYMPIYTDIEGLRKYRNVLNEGEEVVLHEKIHGTNARFIYQKDRLWAGTHRRIVKNENNEFYFCQSKRSEGPTFFVDVLIFCMWYIYVEYFLKFMLKMKGVIKYKKIYSNSFGTLEVKFSVGNNLWWMAAQKYNLEKKLKKVSGIALYGEIFGQVQDLTYGAQKDELFLRFFDAWDSKTGKYLDYNNLVELLNKLELPMVPELYRGPWSNSLENMANGMTTISDANNVREGFVVRPIKEREENKLGRVILKMVGEDYHLRKGSK